MPGRPDEALRILADVLPDLDRQQNHEMVLSAMPTRISCEALPGDVAAMDLDLMPLERALLELRDKLDKIRAKRR